MHHSADPTLTLRHGNIADAEADAIVNAWNRNFIPSWLLLPQGVSKALRERGGAEPFRQLRKHGILPLGGAVVTEAGSLNACWIVHVAALHAYWVASEASVARGYREAFRAAADVGAKMLASPLLGAGTGGLAPMRSLELLRAAWRARPTSLDCCQVWIHERRVFEEIRVTWCP